MSIKTAEGWVLRAGNLSGIDWLRSLEQWFDVKMIVGSHGGCQRILASPASAITTLAGLKSKKIAVFDLAEPAKVAFTARQGGVRSGRRRRLAGVSVLPIGARIPRLDLDA